METRIVEGSLDCPLYGKISGDDCSCLRNKSCDNCFVYAALGTEEDNKKEEDNKIFIN